MLCVAAYMATAGFPLTSISSHPNSNLDGSTRFSHNGLGKHSSPLSGGASFATSSGRTAGFQGGAVSSAIFAHSSTGLSFTGSSVGGGILPGCCCWWSGVRGCCCDRRGNKDGCCSVLGNRTAIADRRGSGSVCRRLVLVPSGRCASRPKKYSAGAVTAVSTNKATTRGSVTDLTRILTKRGGLARMPPAPRSSRPLFLLVPGIGIVLWTALLSASCCPPNEFRATYDGGFRTPGITSSFRSYQQVSAAEEE